VGPLLVSPVAEPEPQARAVRTWADRQQVRVAAVVAGARADVGAWRIDVLGPVGEPSGDGSVPNNGSVLLRAERDGVRLLLLGDAELEAQRRVLQAAGDVIADVDVVKVAHHGSAVQDPRLIAWSRPQIALIGVGCGNTYGHPAASTLRAYAAAGAIVGRTDLHGDVAVVRDGGSGVRLVTRGAGAAPRPRGETCATRG
jgi:competence protein ComEC